MTDLAAPLDELRVALSEVDVLAVLTGEAFGEADWMEPDPAVVEVMATLLRLIEKSSFAAGGAYHRLRRAVADAQPAPAGERTDESMSAEDAAIIRRIRTRFLGLRKPCAEARHTDVPSLPSLSQVAPDTSAWLASTLADVADGAPRSKS